MLPRSWVRISLEAKYLQHLSAQYTEGYSESTEPIDAVNILPLARYNIHIYILRDFNNAPFYIHCFYHMVDLQML